jgi:hypothetical protein
MLCFLSTALSFQPSERRNNNNSTMGLAKDTTQLLKQLRLLMAEGIGSKPLAAYIVPSEDAHHVSILEGNNLTLKNSNFLRLLYRVST